MNCVRFIVFILCSNCALCVLWYTPVVILKQGKLRGLRSVSGQRRYYGIPYAVSERFQPPQAPKTWRGIYKAVHRFGSCAQAIGLWKLGEEDCHQLDVFTPEDVKKHDRLPVLVFFHGGAYYYGSKWHYDPEFLVSKNVVVVVVNYRMGVLGFLCLNNVANLGLKDQTAALRWIRENISAFGGDPDNITISGQSAGASSAAMHFLSKSSEGLFHKALLMSGAAITPWAFNLDPQEAAFEDAAKIGKAKNPNQVYNTFLNAHLPDLLDATAGTSIEPKYFKYSPCVDSNFTDPFFHDAPYNTITSGQFNKVPVIIGSVDVEGMLFYGLNDEKSLSNLTSNFVNKLPSVFSWCSQEDKIVIAQKIRAHYFNNEKGKAFIDGVVNFYSDWIAYASIDPFSKLLAQYSDKPVYNYVFKYEGDRNFAKAIFGGATGLKGASHSDDIFYVFKPGGISLLLNNEDKLIIDRWTTMITNFMKYGDPTPKTTSLLPVRWPAITPSRSLVLQLDHRLSVSELPAAHRGGLLLDLLCTYGLSGYVPCQSKMLCNARQRQ